MSYPKLKLSNVKTISLLCGSEILPFIIFAYLDSIRSELFGKEKEIFDKKWEKYKNPEGGDPYINIEKEFELRKKAETAEQKKVGERLTAAASAVVTGATAALYNIGFPALSCM